MASEEESTATTGTGPEGARPDGGMTEAAVAAEGASNGEGHEDHDGPESAAASSPEPGAEERDTAADDDAADDDAADDDAADDDAADDALAAAGETAADDEPEEGDTKIEKVTANKAAAKSGKEMTPGQRLAAAKAAKAARKAAKRGRTQELTEDKVEKQAAKASEWAHENRRTIYMAVGAVVVGVVGALAWSSYQSSNNAAASEQLWAAVETAQAEIGEGQPEDDDAERFATSAARAEKAVERYRTVLADHSGSAPAIWARLGEATALYEQGEMEEARAAFEKALTEAGDDPIVAWRAIEGIGFTYEATESWDEAISHFQELAELDGGTFRDIANYHLGRMHLAKGDDVRAKEILRELVTSLQDQQADGPVLPYVLAQAEARLMRLDPSLVPASRRGMGSSPGMGPAGAGAGGPGDLSPEQIQELLQRLQSQQGGAPPGMPAMPRPPPGAGPPEGPEGLQPIADPAGGDPTGAQGPTGGEGAGAAQP